VKLAGNFGKIAAGIGSPAEPQVRSGFDSFVEGAAFFCGSTGQDGARAAEKLPSGLGSDPDVRSNGSIAFEASRFRSDFLGDLA